MREWVAAFVAVGFLVGCGGRAETLDTNRSPGHRQCVDGLNPTSPDARRLQAVVEAALPRAAKVVSVLSIDDLDKPGYEHADVRVCGLPIESAHEMRPFATRIARSLRSTPPGAKVSRLSVTNFESYDGNEFGRETKLRVDGFESQLWDGTAADGVEDGAWQVLIENDERTVG